MATGWSASSCTVHARAATITRIPTTILPCSSKNPGTLTEELDKLASLTTAILLDTGAVISAKPFYAGSYRERTIFMHNLREDGLDL